MQMDEHREAILKDDEKKQYRMLGQGNTAEIYQYSADTILKLFRENMPYEAIEKEYQLACKIQTGFDQVPNAFKMVEYRNRYGIVYEQIIGRDMIQYFLKHPFKLKYYSRMLAFYTKDTTGKTITVDPTFINNAIYINNNNVDGDEVLALSSDWVKIRKDDMKFVIDTVKKAVSDGALSDEWFLGQKDTQTQKNQILDVLNVTDCDRIGLMGHSLGGAAAVNLGRERQDIAAVIDLDGTMLGEETGYENGAYLFNEDPYPLPLLSIDNESHYKDGQTAGSYYVNNVIIDRAVQGHHTYIINSGHMNFTDLPLFAPPLAKLLGVGTVDAKHCIDTTNEIVLSFMNYYVKQEGTLNIQESYE